jgi:hypothetical protein
MRALKTPFQYVTFRETIWGKKRLYGSGMPSGVTFRLATKQTNR